MSDSDDSDFFVDESPKKTAKKPPAEKKAKPAAKPKKEKTASDINESMADEDRNVFTNIDNVKASNKKQAIEDIYQKKSQLEHILLRPDTYIGSVEYTEKTPMWIYSPEEEKLVQRDISYVPGLYKIFDEILVNAADNKQRDSKMNLIKIDINKEQNKISVYNNGKGIPVAMHKVENMYVPELIFGTLLTSSNYDDSERKVTGGRNGYGAKLCNIFSTEFTLETSSKEYNKAFKQTWVNNMTKDKDAQVTKNTGEDYTKVTFKPDLKKFKMKELDDDIIHLMMRRAFDVAGSSKGVKVYLNGRLVPVNGFKSYVEQYLKDVTGPTGEPVKVVFEQINPRWEVALTVSEKGFQQVSFVNSIATTKGGRHVDYVADQMVQKMIDTIKKKVGKSTVNVKPFQVKNHMWVFVNALIENPTFDSQTKETMTLQSKSFGSKCELSEKFTKQAISCGVVDAVLAWVRFKQQEDMNKKCSGKKTTKLKGIPKLEDANDAGTKNSQLCTLILTEGDSAKTLAVSGLGVVGRDRYGVFPLRGKLLNVREGNIKQVAENAEINALIKILGLQYKKKYETEDDFKSLRYGKVMVMADQDQDGSHIKGLVINFIHHNWPSLIQRNFVEEFITPIVKATKGKEELSFFSIPEYNEWRNNTDNWKTYKTKYYKGLGTSTSKEAKEYFSDMARHRIRFKYGGKEDDIAVDMAFSKKKIEERKDWLTKWMAEKKDRRAQGLEEEYLYNKDTRSVTFKDFINKELVLFSNTDNERSIPSLIDGFKPGQRKVVFSCFKRADKREVKVAQLAGAVGELSAYHHGEQSLMGTIVNLAQDFVGSNNINLLLPIGQFGTRLQGGKDSASPRYIFTKLSPVARALFPVPDDNVLRFLFEDNQRIEPEWYCPIIPMVLVNGATGIGTAWSTNIPNFNPREIVENMRRLIRGEQPLPIAPWYRGFRGSIVQLDPSRFVCSGVVSEIGDDLIEITELPVKTWTQGYKESVLEPMLDGTDAKGDKEKKPALIADFKEYHTDTTVRFVVKLPPGKLRAMRNEGLHKIFKLQTVLNTTSMVLFDSAGCLRKFNSPEEMCVEFFDTRKQKYIERKAFLEGMLRAQSTRLTNQARFILAKIKGEIIMENKKKAAIVEQLIKQKFDPDPVKKWKEEQKKKELEEAGEVELDDEEAEDEEEEQQGDKKVESKLSDYDYLVGMALIKLSEEEKNKLLKESDDKLAELKTLEKKSWADLWNDDLENFLTELTKWEEHEKDQQESAIKTQAKKFAKEEGKGRGKKTAAFAAEVFPAKDGMRIEPTMEAMKEKYKEKKPREKKEPKEPKEPKKPKKEGGDIKQFLSPVTKGTPKKGKAKKDEWNSDESEEDEEVDFEESRAFESDEDDMDDAEEVIPQKKPRASRATKENDSMEVDEVVIDEDSNPPPPPKKAAPAKKPAASPKKAPEPKKNGKSMADFSDDDDVPKKKPASRKKIMESSDDEDNDAFAPRKPAASKKNIDDVYNIPSDDDEEEEKPPVKKTAPKKKDVIDLSDDDEVVEKKKKPAPAKKATAPKAPKKETKEPPKKMTDFFNKKAGGKKKGESDDEDDDVAIELDDSPPPARKASGRARAKTNYAMNEEDEDSDFDVPKKKRAKKALDSDSD